MNDSSIRIRPINDLLADGQGNPMHFLIPAYQRGYRWTQLQVSQLLDDVWEFIQKSEDGKKEAFYCLQPIVVKACSDGRYEVVDGQQRLTTIHILLTYLEGFLSHFNKTRFTITYETRARTNDRFLENIDLSREQENIDYYHICQAYRAVDIWFSNRDGSHRLKLLQPFLNDDEAGKNVKIIWFQLSDREDAVDAFTRLNVGKIPLTNEELIRALFLRSQSATGNGLETQLRIAHEWDQHEKSLQSDSFWYFINNDIGPKHNRIGFLFDFVARAKGLSVGSRHDPYAIFHAYNQWLQNNEVQLEDVWLQIKEAFMFLEELYENRVLYHIAGFLIYQDIGIAKLRELSENNTKRNFDQELRQEIFSKVIGPGSLIDMNDEELSEQIKDKLESLKYGKNSGDIKSLLLLFNVATLLDNPESNIRFQFDCFKTKYWDIEHVRSVAQYQPQKHSDRVAWLNQILHYFNFQNSNDELQADINSFVVLKQNETTEEQFETLYMKILTTFKEEDEQESDHSIADIANLTLLDQHTNRSYKNAVFAVKRQRILSLDRGGIFVPLCTRNVFLKCYSPHVNNLIYWTKNDQIGYQTAIEDTLARFFNNNHGKFNE